MKIINVIASSLDGCIASGPLETDAQRSAYHLTSPVDQQHVRDLVLESEAIITGAESVRSSGSLRNDRNNHGALPIWAVLTTRGLDANLEFWNQDEHPRWLVSPTAVPLVNNRVVNHVYGQKNPAQYVAEQLKVKGVKTALLFGGGKINALFYAAGLVDELYLTLSPVIVGSKEGARFFDVNQISANLQKPQSLSLKSLRQEGDHVFLHYKVKTALPNW